MGWHTYIGCILTIYSLCISCTIPVYNLYYLHLSGHSDLHILGNDVDAMTSSCANRGIFYVYEYLYAYLSVYLSVYVRIYAYTRARARVQRDYTCLSIKSRHSGFSLLKIRPENQFTVRYSPCLCCIIHSTHTHIYRHTYIRTRVRAHTHSYVCTTCVSVPI